MTPRRTHRWLLLLVLAATASCGVLFDFDDYGRPAEIEAGLPDAPAPADAGALAIVGVSPLRSGWRVGTSTTLTVTIARPADVSGVVALNADELPEDISVASPGIAAGASAGELTLTAGPHAHAGRPSTIRVLATTNDGRSATHPLDIVLEGAPGQVDETFGDAGTVVTTAHFGQAILDGDAIVIAGNGADGPAAFRMLADGTPDPSFGDGGVVSFGPDKVGFGAQVTLVPEGYVLLRHAGLLNSVVLVDRQGARVMDFADGGAYSQNGFAVSLGSTTTGAVIATAGLIGELAVRWLDRHGNVVASYSGTGKGAFLNVDRTDRVVVFSAGLHAIRLQPDAGVDPTFEDPADAAAALASATPLAAVLVPDGLVVSGSFDDFGLVKLKSSGAIDPSYGTGGFATPAGPALTVERDGGRVYLAQGIGLARVTPSGAIDPSFPITNDSSERGTSILVQSHGRIVVVGERSIRRYWP